MLREWLRFLLIETHGFLQCLKVEAKSLSVELQINRMFNFLCNNETLWA